MNSEQLSNGKCIVIVVYQWRIQDFFTEEANILREFLRSLGAVEICKLFLFGRQIVQ